MLRSHTCGELTKKNIGDKVDLYGWARSIREHKDVVFINLTDRYGWTQIILKKEQCKDLTRESFIRVQGKVIARTSENINDKVSTGEIEVECTNLELFAPCKPLPFDIQDNIDVKEDIRLKYRFLDIRRPQMLSRLEFRARLASTIRKYMEEMRFLEVETPYFVRSTPEGCRDFLVPSRTIPGNFYALPQSPQLYKQTLMIAGIDRYFQFPRCFRDEDPRRERQLVHTQLDLEMALVSQDDIFAIVEGVMCKIYKELFQKELSSPFVHHTYAECMNRWGLDKPDLRFGMEIVDFAEAVKGCGFDIFEQAFEKKHIIKGLVIPGCASYSRKQIEELETFVKTFHVERLITFKVKGKSLEGSAAKKMKPESLSKMLDISKANDGDLIIVCAESPTHAHRALGELRKLFGKRLNLIDRSQIRFLWVTDFPLFEWDEELNRWAPMHHMFTMPNPKYLDTLESNTGAVTGILFDLVLNGVELGSGSLRITSPALQKRIMKIIGMSEEEACRRFGFLLDAYEYAAPPHGGMGIGLDNLTMTLLGLENIRDAIAFPNASNGVNLHDGSPSPIDPDQIEELHISLKLPPEKK